MSVKHRSTCELQSGAKRCLCNAFWLQVSLSLGLLVVAIEVIGSWYSGSLALLADSAHTALDALFYGFAIFVQRRLYARPDEDEHRWQHAASELNGMLFMVAAAGIVFEVVRRGGEMPVNTALMGWVAAASLILNLCQYWALKLGARDRTNTQVNIHNLTDAAQSAVICLAAILAQFGAALPGFIDAVISSVIGAYLFYQGVEALHGGHHH